MIYAYEFWSFSGKYEKIQILVFESKNKIMLKIIHNPL